VISLNGSANSGGDLNILSGADDGKWFNAIGLDVIMFVLVQQQQLQARYYGVY
jgi:hypothetical protein